MGMHTIPVIYDPTTRRISLASGQDTYGGATTDVNSVTISVTGIVPEGTNFIARVDFAVLVETGNRVVNRPFILLEQVEDRWEAIIPNAILKATKDVHRLPIQLILANDSQVINSRNTIVLETTTAIDATASGNGIPDYEMPDWPLPTGVSESLDVLTLDVTYDPLTRMITLPDSDMYGGATIDTNSVRINVTGIPAECDARLDFATAIRVDNSTVIKPFVVLDSIGTVFSAMIPQSVLMAAKETKKLPFQLVTRHGDTVINSRNTIVLEITRAINAMESVESAYTPYVMYRNDTWAWMSDFTYDTGAVVTYDGDIYIATQPSMGQQPSIDSEYWEPSVGETIVTLNGHRINDPDFYAPLLSGTSGEYLESRGANQSPEWVSKITEITGESNTLPTTTAVKNYVDAETSRATAAEGLLDDKIDLEIQNRIADVDAEETRAKGVESNLNTAIGNEVTRATGVESGLNNRISILETETVNDGGRYLTKTNRTLDHDLTTRSNSTDTAILTNGGTATFIDSLSSNETGHVTASNTKTVTLPKVTAGTGITITDDDLPSPATGKQIIVGHSNSINAHTSADVGSGNLIPIIRNDAQGHLTKVDSTYVNIPTSQVTSLTGYSEASSEGQLATTDTLNQALGKIQKGINSKARINHADGSTDFGRATTSLYGHVKIVTATNTPSGTSNENVPTEAKMAEFVNSSIGTATANFLGTFNAVSDLGIPQATVDNYTFEPTPAVESEVAGYIASYLNTHQITPTNNDYLFISVNKTQTIDVDWYWRFKFDGTGWLYEYTLNNSSFTATQWATINSLLSNRSVTDTEHYPAPISLDVVDIDANITASTTHIADTDIHVTTTDKSDWNAKYDKPVTGIPKTDLAQSVQSSLDLADSSLQAHQSIKTINSTTMVGTGNINLQVPLVGSGTGQNIKTVGGTDILGTGDIPFPTVVNSAPTLAWATQSQIGSVGGTALQVTMPSNPVTKANIETALNVSSTYNDQALIVKNGVLNFGEAGKVDDVQINGASIVSNKIAVIPITVTDVTLADM